MSSIEISLFFSVAIGCCSLLASSQFISVNSFYVSSFNEIKAYDEIVFDRIMATAFSGDIGIIQGIDDPYDEISEMIDDRISLLGGSYQVFQAVDYPLKQALVVRNSTLKLDSSRAFVDTELFHTGPIVSNFRYDLGDGMCFEFAVVSAVGQIARSREALEYMEHVVESVMHSHGQEHPIVIVGALNPGFSSSNNRRYGQFMRRQDVAFLNRHQRTMVLTDSWNDVIIAVGSMVRAIPADSVGVSNYQDDPFLREVAVHISDHYPIHFSIDLSKLIAKPFYRAASDTQQRAQRRVSGDWARSSRQLNSPTRRRVSVPHPRRLSLPSTSSLQRPMPAPIGLHDSSHRQEAASTTSHSVHGSFQRPVGPQRRHSDNPPLRQALRQALDRHMAGGSGSHTGQAPPREVSQLRHRLAAAARPHVAGYEGTTAAAASSAASDSIGGLIRDASLRPSAPPSASSPSWAAPASFRGPRQQQQQYLWDRYDRGSDPLHPRTMPGRLDALAPVHGRSRQVLDIAGLRSRSVGVYPEHRTAHEMKVTELEYDRGYNSEENW